MSSVSRPTTPIQSVPKQTECPGAPERPPKIAIPDSLVGKKLNFDDLKTDAPVAPRAVPSAPKKARFSGEFSDKENIVKELFKA